MSAEFPVQIRRATAPSTNGRALKKHDANPWYSGRIVRGPLTHPTFPGEPCWEAEFSDTGTRTFATASEIRK